MQAYKEFTKEPRIVAAIGTFLQESKAGNMMDLKKASEKCVAAISSANLPDQVSTQVSSITLSLSGA